MGKSIKYLDWLGMKLDFTYLLTIIKKVCYLDLLSNVLGVLHALLQLIEKKILWVRCYQNSHFIAEETEARGVKGSDDKASACNVGDPGSIPGLGSSPGEGNGNLLQYSCLENPMDGGAWWATVHVVAKSWTWLSNFIFTFPFKGKRCFLVSVIYSKFCGKRHWIYRLWAK